MHEDLTAALHALATVGEAVNEFFLLEMRYRMHGRGGWRMTGGDLGVLFVLKMYLYLKCVFHSRGGG